MRNHETARRALSGSILKLPRTFRIRVSKLLSFSAIHNTGSVYTGPGTGPLNDRDHSVYVGGRGADLFAAAASRLAAEFLVLTAVLDPLGGRITHVTVNPTLWPVIPGKVPG
jgi:hypothetical protein